MKNLTLILILTALAVLVTACGGGSAAQPAAAVVPAAGIATQGTPAAAAGQPPLADAGLSDAYDDALSIRNQLAFGTLQLEGTADAVTPAQAAQLLPLWQALTVLGTSSTSAPEEIAAVQNQISAAMTPAQIAAIAQMRLTNSALQAYYVEIGVSEAKTPEPGVTPQGVSMRDVPPEQRESVRATAQALGTPVGSGGGGAGSAKRNALLDNVVQLLSERAGQ